MVNVEPIEHSLCTSVINWVGHFDIYMATSALSKSNIQALNTEK